MAAANAALADLAARPEDPGAIRRLNTHIGLALDLAEAAQEAGVDLPEAARQQLVDTLDALKVRAYRFLR